MITVPLDENKSIPHDFIGKFGSASVLLKKSPEGTGIMQAVQLVPYLSSQA